MSWTYEQATGRLLNSSGGLQTVGYSGMGEGKNNPDLQDQHNVGPIPVGRYLVGAPFDSPTHGPYALHLEPNPANEMFGRSGFLMHGDSISHAGLASQGCIIVDHASRVMVWSSGDHELIVVSGREIPT